jgi:hypothetical protein
VCGCAALRVLRMTPVMALTPFKIVFKTRGELKSWVRFYVSQAEAEADAKVVVRREYPEAQVVDVLETLDPRIRSIPRVF